MTDEDLIETYVAAHDAALPKAPPNNPTAARLAQVEASAVATLALIRAVLNTPAV